MNKKETDVELRLAQIQSEMDDLKAESDELKEKFKKSHKVGEVVFVSKYDKKIDFAEGSTKTKLDMRVLKKLLSRRVFKKLIMIKAEDIKKELPAQEAADVISSATVIIGGNKPSVKVKKLSAADKKKILKDSKETIVAEA